MIIVKRNNCPEAEAHRAKWAEFLREFILWYEEYQYDDNSHTEAENSKTIEDFDSDIDDRIARIRSKIQRLWDIEGMLEEGEIVVISFKLKNSSAWLQEIPPVWGRGPGEGVRVRVLKD